MKASLAFIRSKLDSDWWELLRGMSMLNVIQALGLVSMFSLQLFLTRTLTVEQFGSFANGRSMAALVASLAGLGFASSAFRFLPVFKRNEDWQQIKGWLRFTHSTTFLFNVFIAAVLIAVFAYSTLGAPPGASRLPVLVMFSISIPLVALSNLLAVHERAMGGIAVPFALGQIAAPTLLLLLLVSLWASGAGTTPVNYAMAFLVAQALVVSVHFIYLRQMTGQQVREAEAKFDRLFWIRTSLPLMILSGHMFLLNQIDVLLFGFHGQLAMGGIYENTQKIANLMALPLAAVGSIPAAQYSVLHENEKPHVLAAYVAKVLMTMMAVTVAAGLFLLVFNKPILGAFGAEYAKGADVLNIRLLGVLVLAAATPAGHLLAVTGHEREVFWIFILSIATELVFGHVLIGMYGMEGMAAARVLTLVILQFLLARSVRRRLGFWPVFLLCSHSARRLEKQYA